jgi:hypothetical protein
MNVDKYFPEPGDCYEVSRAKEIPVVQKLFKAIELIREELREQTEGKPKHSPNDLRKDLVFLLGVINGLNRVLNLPDNAYDRIKELPKGEM